MEQKKLADVRICPCKDCKERHDLCHMDCKKYLFWKKGIDYNRKILQAEKELERLTYEYRFPKKRRRNDK